MPLNRSSSTETANTTIVVALFSVALIGGLVNAVFQPAITAAIPDLVPADKVAAGNSLNQFSVQASVLVGQAVGGVLYRLLGAPFLFLFDGISYLVSALSESFIRIPQKRIEEKLPLGQTLAAYRRDTLEGVRYVWRRSGMRRAPIIGLALFLVVGICTGMINIFVITLFQITTPGEMRGRVMALVIALSGAATPLGMALGGLLGDLTDKNIPFLYILCGTLIGVLSLSASTHSPFREFLAWDIGTGDR